MNNITFATVSESDFDHFRTLSKSVIKEHIDGLGLPWIEEEQDSYHRELFDEPGLRKIMLDKTCIGYAGVRQQDGFVEIGRVRIEAAYQKRGIGTQVLDMILQETDSVGQRTELNVILSNRARRMYERAGFKLVREDTRLAYYERPAAIPRAQPAYYFKPEAP